MSAVHKLITDHLEIWTAADTEKKSGRGRASANANSVYGINKLRELVLELALSGKLVPQNPEDEPVNELLKRVRLEKAKLIAEGKIKEGKKTSLDISNTTSTSLPASWSWIRLDDVAYSQAGFAFKSNGFNENKDGLPLIRIRDVGQSFTGTYYVGEYREEFIVVEGDYLISMDGEFRVSKWLNGNALLNQRVSRLIFFGSEISRRFIADALQARLKALQGIKAYTTVDHLSGAQISNSIICLPPLEEQHRIVAKVDELMALCDQLEAQHNNAADAHEQLVSHLLNTLTQSQDAEDFNANWQRIATHFDTLFNTESSIDALKQTLLQLAVMGKLVPQDPNDEPASELLKRIQVEKAKLVAEGKIKKGNPIDKVEEKVTRFVIPKTWEWVRMEELCRPISSGSTPAAEFFHYEDGVPFLKVYNIRDQKIDFAYKKQFVSESLNSTKLARSILYPGDIVMNIVGPPLGKVAIIPDTYPQWNCNQAIVFFGLIPPMNADYTINYLKEGSYLDDIELIGTAGQDNISVTKSKNILVPVPPIEEQSRIVSKVQELIELCEQLKSCIHTENQLQLKLTDALVARALN